MDADDDTEKFPTAAERLAADRASRAAWDQIPGEPGDAFRAFQAFLRYPTDVVSGFARETQRSVSATGAMAARWSWRARRAAFEHVLTQEATRAAFDAARAAGAEHGRVAAEGLDWALASMRDARARQEFLNPKDALAYAKTMIEIQRLLAGEATTRTALDLSGASAEKLAALDALVKDLASGTENG